MQGLCSCASYMAILSQGYQLFEVTPHQSFWV